MCSTEDTESTVANIHRCRGTMLTTNTELSIIVGLSQNVLAGFARSDF